MVVVLPNFLANDSGIIPIRLLGSREVHLEITPEDRIERHSEAHPQREESTSSSRTPPVDTAFLKKKMAELSLGERLKGPSLDALLPPLEKNVTREERIRRISSSPFYKEIARAFEESSETKGNYGGVTFSIDASPEVLKRDKVQMDPGTELVLMRVGPVIEEESPGKQKAGMLGIKGPIAQRELIYRPPLPKVESPIDRELEMKLWVRPNGAVDRVISVNRIGDAQLEVMATDYLRQWRFQAIPENEPQVEEWGTVTVRFGLK
jgi:hypothetical protein